MLASTLLLAVLSAHAGCPVKPGPLYKHSHNDYTRDHPLYDALAHDFDSVEADIHLKNGQLLVCHDSGDCHSDKSLESMYLAPLYKIFQRGKGWVRPNQTPLTLLIEFKDDGEQTYRAVLPLLRKYQDMLTVASKGKVRRGAVPVVITGHVPRQTITKAEPRLMAVDGGEGDLASDVSPDLVPWVSLDWDSHNRDVKDLECRARQHHRLLRLWGGSDDEFQWLIECAAGVDILSTNHLTRFDRVWKDCRALRSKS